MGWRLRERLLVLAAMALYLALYHWAYTEWLAPKWGYFGFTYYTQPFGYVIFACAMAILPASWMPLSLTRPSQFVYWIVYVVIFVPSMFGPLYMALRPREEIALFMLAMQAGMAIIGCCYLIPMPKIRMRPIDSTVFWAALIALIMLLDVWVVASFRGTMRLVSFKDVYGLRAEAKSVMESGLVGYALLLLSIAFNPLLMAAGLVKKRMLFVLAGAAGQILIYLCTGMKSDLFSVPVVLCAYFVAERLGRRLGLIIAGGCAGVFVLVEEAVKFAEATHAKIVDGILFIVVTRTFAMTGMVSGEYEDFFHHQPLTHLTHAKPFNLFSASPYQYGLGYEIGAFYKGGSALLNENGHFWAGDGIAGFGIPGVVYISLLVALVFWLIDYAGKGHRLWFVAAWISYIGIVLANNSILTTLGSGGLGLMIVLLTLMPPLVEPRFEIRDQRTLARRTPG